MTTNIRPVNIRYCILFPGRTGSTYLTDHLVSHPEIIAHYEILSQHTESWEQQESFLNQFIGESRADSIKAIGFKTKLRSVLNLDAFRNHLIDQKYRIIHLTRSNPLKFVISIVRAKQLREKTGSSNLIDDSYQPLGPTTIPLEDFAKAKTRLRRHNRLMRFIDGLNLPALSFTYEDMLKNEQRALANVWDFLEVKRVATRATTKRLTPGDLQKSIINLDEILSRHPEMAPFVNQL